MDLRNRIRLVGNCGAPPKLRYATDGSPMTSFRFAVDEPRSKEGGETKTWWTAELYGKTAERACEMVRKGVSVTVEGRFRMEEWTDEQKRQRYTLYVAQADFLVHERAPNDPPA